MTEKDAVATAETISEQRMKRAMSIVIVPLMDTESDMSNALNIGADDGRKITNGMVMGMAENYKHLYEQTKKMLAMYQDELVPGFRKEIEGLEGKVCDLRKKWQSAETHICTMCEHFDHKTDGNIVYGNKTCGELVGYPCCGKFKLRATDNNVGDKMTPTDKDTNVPSNGDRIRAMTDEELAKLMVQITDLDIAIGYCKELPECNELLDTVEGIPASKCEKCMMEWLRKPAEVDNG